MIIICLFVNNLERVKINDLTVPNKNGLFKCMHNNFMNQELTDIQNIWNQFADENGLAKIIKLSPGREKAVKARLKEAEFNIYKILDKVKESDFCKGKNNHSWKVDFDFVFCSANNYLKILEGKYENRSGQRNSRSSATDEEILNAIDKSFNVTNKPGAQGQ